MDNWHFILILVLVFAVIWGNVALLKYSAKFSMKSFTQDPIEKAKKALEEKQVKDEQNKKESN